MGQSKSEVRSIVQGWLQDLRQAGDVEIDPYFGKRKEPRFYVWTEALELRADGEQFVARGENLSVQGAGFVCKRSLERGARVELRRVTDAIWVPVRVQHCTQTIGAFKIGVTFSLA